MAYTFRIEKYNQQACSPYNGAKGGIPGKGVGGYLVPAPGDTAHQFIAPTDQDIRGPCPGLNAAANRMFYTYFPICKLSY